MLSATRILFTTCIVSSVQLSHDSLTHLHGRVRVEPLRQIRPPAAVARLRDALLSAEALAGFLVAAAATVVSASLLRDLLLLVGGKGGFSVLILVLNEVYTLDLTLLIK